MKFGEKFEDPLLFQEALDKKEHRLYLLLSSKEGERAALLSMLSQRFSLYSEVKRCGLAEALAHLRTPSLFAEKVSAFVHLEKPLTAQEVQQLGHYLDSPPSKTALVIAAAQLKYIGPPPSTFHKDDSILLDLTLQKPWEEAKRCREWILSWVHKRGKKISNEAVHMLAEASEKDQTLLASELEKLCVYTLEKETISQEDVERIGALTLSSALLDRAKALVWHGQTEKICEKGPIELSELLPLIAFFRNQLEMGLKMSALLKKKKGKAEIQKAFPKLWPKAFEECFCVVSEKKESYFLRALTSLFKMEEGIKKGIVDPENGLALFCTTFKEDI